MLKSVDVLLDTKDSLAKNVLSDSTETHGTSHVDLLARVTSVLVMTMNKLVHLGHLDVLSARVKMVGAVLSVTQGVSRYFFIGLFYLGMYR